jgi:PST family polysaccharide transporter
MIKKLRSNKLLSNFLNLSFLQLLTLFIPLLTYPYLIRVLGKSTYGSIIFAQVIVAYAIIFIDFGFNLFATSEVSKNKNSKEKIEEIFINVISIKILCFILVLFTFFMLNWFFEFDTLLYLLSLGVLIYDVFFPLWYFQGVEKMSYITILVIPFRLLSLVSILIFVKEESDYLYVPLIYGIFALMISISSIYVIIKHEKIKINTKHLIKIKEYFKNASYIFISNFVISLYLTSNKFIVGIFFGKVNLAYYDLAEKIVGVLKVFQSIISQTIFPKINRDQNIVFIKKMLKISLFINILLSLIVYLNSSLIISVLGGSEMLNSSTILNILLLTVPIVGLSNFFGIQMLIPFGYKKDFSKIVSFSAIIYCFIILFLIFFNIMTIINISICLVLVEFIVAVVMFYQTKKNKIWKKNMII